MPTFLTRLRSAKRSKSTSTPAIDAIESDIAHHDRRDAHASPDASLDSPSQNVGLDSKIHPELSALFTSVEDALKTVERAAATQKQRHVYDDTGADWTSKNDYGDEGAEGEFSEKKSMDDGALYASFGYGAGWSTFGRDENTSLKAPERTHISDRNKAISAHFRPSSADAVLSWSPKADESSESLRPSGSSHSSPALCPSPEAQQDTQQSVYYSPSPGTFGHPSPSHFTPAGSPAFPPPVFHSTPKMSASPLQSMHKPSLGTSSRFRLAGVGLPPLSSTFGRMKRKKSGQPRSDNRLTSAPTNEATDRQQIPSRPSTSFSRGPNRRKSAEWNAQAASAGAAADPAQTTEFGWPAEVSREILRLSLGEQAMVHTQDSPLAAVATDSEKAVAKSGDRANSKRGGPRVSHEQNYNGRHSASLMRSSISEQRLSSAHLYSSTLPPSSSSSSSSPAPGRSDGPQSFATQLVSTPHEIVKSRLQSSSNNALDRGSDAKMGAAGMAEPSRSGSGNRIEWESRELQDLLSREGGGGALRPSTPMKQSASESTYETAGSSSFLHAPSLSVIAPTPRGSPGRSRNDSGAEPEAGDGLQVPTPPPQSDKSKGKRKAEESEDGSPPDLRGSKGKKMAFATDGKRSQRSSNASHAPSSFQSLQSQKSRKRVRLSSPMATPDHSRPGSAIPPHTGSVSSRGSSRSMTMNSLFQHSDNKTVPPRPQSRASRASRTSRAMSAGASGASSGGGTVPFPKRRSLSQSSIPISAIVSPRAPSLDRLSSFHMRDPQKPPPRRDVGWSLRFSSRDEKGSPFMAWAFWFGFLFPLLWWLASFWRIPKTRMVGTDTEKAVIVDDPYFEREARAWRLRCRIASVLFFVTYAPVIILLAIFAPRS